MSQIPNGFSLRRRGPVTCLEVEPFGAAGLCHAVFSTRLGGVSGGVWNSLNLGAHVGDEPSAVAENWRRFGEAAGFAPEARVAARQVHGAVVRVVRADDPPSPGGQVGECDALITAAVGPVLVVSVADCVPIYILDPMRGAGAVVHAGWRGTLAGAAAAALAGMAEAFGTRPQDCLAALGPAIGPCCYEVDDPVANLFGEAYGEPVLSRREDRWFVDLWGANRAGLAAAGVSAGQVYGSGLCTACRRDLFYSHRAEGGRTGRMAAVLWLTSPGQGVGKG